MGVSAEKIRALADDAPVVSLALSLHGATQALREELMPHVSGGTYSLSSLVEPVTVSS